MERIHADVLTQLMQQSANPAVTIYAPMHTSAAPPHISENQIRFKNLMHKAATEAKEAFGAKGLADMLEAELDKRINDVGFWESQSPGLLICANNEGIRLFALPIDTEEYVAVDTGYYLAPIMGMLNDSQNFVVLSLAQHDPKLYVGSLYGLEESPITLPSNVHNALNIDEPNQKSENQGTASGPSMDQSWFNGRGGAKNPAEDDRHRFWRMIDKLVYDKVDRSLPLVLAGVESDTVEYRAISRFPKILNGVVTGNHKADSLQSLYTAAKDIVWNEIVHPKHMEAIEEYERLSGANPDRVAETDAAIAEAAGQGRIDKLLAVFRMRTSDTVRDAYDEVPRLTFPAKDQAKVVNDIAMTVWQTSGAVFNLSQEEMPRQKLMLARLRY